MGGECEGRCGYTFFLGVGCSEGGVARLCGLEIAAVNFLWVVNFTMTSRKLAQILRHHFLLFFSSKTFSSFCPFLSRPSLTAMGLLS